MKCESDSKASLQRLQDLHATTPPQAQKDKVSSSYPNLDENMIAHLGLQLFIVAIIINLKRNGRIDDLASDPFL